MSTGRSHHVDQLGRFTPKSLVQQELGPGDVGFVVAGIKEIDGAPVGDTITLENRPAAAPLPGFKQIQPRVFAGLFPVNSEDYENFRDALAKLQLERLGAALRAGSLRRRSASVSACGFLGLLHMDIVQERLEREYQLTLITSAPTVVYEVARTDGDGRRTSTTRPSSRRPTRSRSCASRSSSPTSWCRRITSARCWSCATTSAACRRRCCYLGTQVSLQYQLPLAEVVLDFFDRLKSASRGYASFDYEFSHFQAAPLVKLDILINGDKVDALSIIVHRTAPISAAASWSTRCRS